MSKLASALMCLSLPALAYVIALTYLAFAKHWPFDVPFLGSYGVLVGLISVAGFPLASAFFATTRTDDMPRFPAIVMVVCLLGLVGLYQIMRWNGDFSEAILGPHTAFLDMGFTLGVVAGIGTAATLLVEKR